MTSTTERPILRAVPSENWDEDFEFQANEHCDTHATSLPARSPVDTPPSNLHEWAEPGPSTPNRRRAQPSQTENWDDDFEDAGDSPARPTVSYSHRKRNHNSVGSSKRRAGQAIENWDDEFELGFAEPPSGTRRSRQRGRYASSDSDSDHGELGFGDKEDDKTITARSRRGLAATATPPPPVPPIPPLFSNPSDPSPFPGSPTASVFSVPTSRDRDSMSIAYGSTAALNLHPTLSGSSSAIGHVTRGFAALPPSPPIHRERRRLRKKSRPRPLDGNLIELVDMDPDEDTQPVPIPRTPEQHEADLPSTQPPSEPSSPQQTRAPLLSRIGSVSKRWGRRKRSVGPDEVLMHEREREPPSGPVTDNDATPVAPSQSRSARWFFRGGVGTTEGEVSGTESQDEGEGEREVESPTKKKGRRKSENGLKLQPKSRPSPDALALSSPPGSPLKHRAQLFTRHVSYGGRSMSKSSSNGSGSMSMEDLSLRSKSSREPDVPKLNKEKGREKEPSMFMNRIRRISLGTPASGLKPKHRKTKSSMGPDDTGQEGLAVSSLLPPLSSPSPFASQADLSFSADSRMDPKPTQAPLTTKLLPPIELRPPSPSRSPSESIRASESEPIPSSSVSTSPLDMLLRPSTGVSSVVTPTKLSMSPQSASLGRSSQSPVAANSSAGNGSSGTIVPRRNSLGDLKIPARISQAQSGLRRDLELVRDFAASVDKLKHLQLTYVSLAHEVQQVLITSRPSSPPVSSPSTTSFFGFSKQKGRARSNTNPVPPPDAHAQFASDYQSIESRYKIVWECAELLIELGGGGPTATASPSTSVSAPAMQVSQSAPPIDGRKSRERAITLAGDESKPDPVSLPISPPIASPPNPSWRASTGRHDLSSRQLLLLREMLHASDTSPSSSFLGAHAAEIPEETVINRGWKWGDAMSSTITLPSEESSAIHSSPMQKRRTSKLGMSGLRDMLRLLKKNTLEQQYQLKSAVSVSTIESSLDVRHESKSVRSQVPTQRRRAKTSSGPEEMKSLQEHLNSPYGTSSSLSHKPSPRRPSLASIFRIGQKHKVQGNANPSTDDVMGTTGLGHSRSATEEEEDWDEIDSTSDLDLAARAFGVSPDGMATVKGRSKKNKSPYQLQLDAGQSGRPITPHTGPNASQSSIWGDARRLSNVEENGDGDQRQSRSVSKSRRRSSIFPSSSPKRPPSRGWKPGKSGSVRSAPPMDTPAPDPKLAMTPQNIKPLLENAKEVELRLNDCIEELRGLLTAKPAGEGEPNA